MALKDDRPDRPSNRRAGPAALAGLLGPQWWWILGTALAAFATLGSGIGLIATSAYLISRAALVDSTASLALAITGVRFFAVCRAAFRYVERYVGHLATFRVLTRVRVWFFRGIEPLAPAGLASERGGDLLARILGDIDTLQDLALRVAVPAIAAGLVTVLTAVVLGSFSAVLGVAAVAFLALVGIVLPVVTHALVREPSEALAAADGALEAEAVESVAGLAELVMWGREDRFSDAVAGATDRRCELDRRLAGLRGAVGGLTALVVGLGAMTVLALAVPMVRDGDLDGVELAVVPLVMIAAFEAVTPLTAATEHLGRARTAAGRLEDLLESEPPVTEPGRPVGLDPAAHAAVDLRVQGVTFGYSPDAGPVLAELSMDVPAGTEVHVVGPSGSGKSTVVDLLLRFREHTAGSISVAGVEWSDLGSLQVRRLIAAVQQHDHLFDTSVRDNLLLADPDADDDRIAAALEAADAAEFVDGLPQGLDTRVGEDGGRLSGGERQRLMIARALLADAPVLLLDEATAHLDGPGEARVFEGVRRWQRGRTLMVLSHGVPPGPPADLVVALERDRPPRGTRMPHRRPA